MKTREQLNNVIFKDKDLEPLLRQIVQVASQKGFCMTNVSKALCKIWQDEAPVVAIVDHQPDFTEKEKKFFAKARKFVDHYSEDLLHFDKQHYGIMKNLDSYYYLLCSTYAVFQKEDKMLVSKVGEYAKSRFDQSWSNLSSKIDSVHSFFHNHLYIVENEEFPVYDYGYFSSRNGKSIPYYEGFQEFKSQYADTNSRIFNFALKSIWAIDTYF